MVEQPSAVVGPLKRRRAERWEPSWGTTAVTYRNSGIESTSEGNVATTPSSTWGVVAKSERHAMLRQRDPDCIIGTQRDEDESRI